MMTSKLKLHSMTRLALLSLVAALTVQTGDRLPGFSRSAPVLLPAGIAEALERASGEDVEGRSDWFYFQRAYPFESIPIDARRRAWESRPLQVERGILPMAKPTWQSIGPSPTVSAFLNAWGFTSGRINSVAISPLDPNLILVGTSTGGIWRSTDGGNSFITVSDDHVDLAVGFIAFAPSNPSVVYAGMGDTKLLYLGTGVLKSTNGGITWQRVSNSTLPPLGAIGRLEVDPLDHNRLYVAQYTRVSVDRLLSSGLYTSTDGGVNWTLRLPGPARDVCIDPADRNVIYAGMARIDEQNPRPAGVYRSSDRGSTWDLLFPLPYGRDQVRDVRVAVSPANPLIIYVYTGGFIGAGVDVRLMLSTDGGATWTRRSLVALDTAQFSYNTYIVADPVDPDRVYIGSRDVFRSDDQGETVQNLTFNFVPGPGGTFGYAPGGSRSHPDQHALAFVPGRAGEFYIGNDGGLSKTTDEGRSFQSLNGTLSLTQFIGISLHPTKPWISYGGTQDNGTQRRLLGVPHWHEFASGDGGRSVIDAIDHSIVFTTYIRGVVFRFGNDGTAFQRQVAWNGTFGEPDPGGRIAFYPPFVGNGVDQTLYFGTWRLFISTDRGDSWQAPSGLLDMTKGITESGRDVLTAIGASGSNTNYIYTGSAQGRVLSSTNGGTSWTDVSGGLPNRSITSITVSRTNPETAYITFSGFATGHIFKTTNAGRNWTNISSNLPDIPVNALLIDPLKPNMLYAGTDIGVFRTKDDGGNWAEFNRGLPPVVVKAFSAQSNGLIQIATYGRGAYEMAPDGLPTGDPFITSIAFDGLKRLTITGDHFSADSRVLINGTDRSSRLKRASTAELFLKGKRAKLGLVDGENTIQVVSQTGLMSNVFALHL